MGSSSLWLGTCPPHRGPYLIAKGGVGRIPGVGVGGISGVGGVGGVGDGGEFLF